LIVQLRFRPPSYWRSSAYVLFKQTKGQYGWDGYTCPLKLKGEEGEIPRGHLNDLKNAADVLGIGLNLDAMLQRPFRGLLADDIPSDIIEGQHGLDPAQRECVANWLNESIGINHISVNGGKTACFAGAAAFIKRSYPKSRVLYITQSERLVRQAFKDMAVFLPDWHITQFGGGVREKDGKDLVIATAAILNKNFKELKDDGWFKTFVAVLVDESHHASSPSFQKILKSIPAFFRLGASDTLREDDLVRSSLIRGSIGPILDKQIHAEELVLSGRSAKPKIYVVDDRSWAAKFADLEQRAPEDSEAWCLLDGKWEKGLYLGPAIEGDPNAPDGIKRDKKGEPITRPNFQRIVIHSTGHEREVESRWCLLYRLHDQAIVRFKERNRYVADWAAHFSKKDWPTLVIATRTIHCLILQALIKDRVNPGLVKVLYGEHNSKERDNMFQWLKTTPGSVLITPLVKEGVSINEIRGGVIADHIVSWEVMEQMIGRFVRRKLEGPNEAEVVMFIDRQHSSYRRSSIKLLEKLEKTRGYTFCYPILGPGSESQANLFDAK
jgi:superfamily II DNA or RNA helicase